VSGRVVRLIWDDAVAVLGQLQAAANLGYTLATQRGLQIALVARRSTQGGARIRQHTGDDPRLIRPEPFPVRQAYNGPALCGCDALDCGRPTRTAVAGSAGASQASVPTEFSRAPRRTRPSRGPAAASSGSPRRCSEYSASMMQGRPTSESGLANFGKRAAGYSPPRLVLRSTPTRTATSGSGYSWPLVSETADARRSAHCRHGAIAPRRTGAGRDGADGLVDDGHGGPVPAHHRSHPPRRGRAGRGPDLGGAQWPRSGC